MRFNPWIMIFVGGLFEAVWATTMNMSDGFTDLFWTPVTFGISLISVWFLYQGFRMGRPVGSSYAAWTGCGTVLSTVFGLVFYDQLLSGLQVLFLAILIGGILLLQYVDDPSRKTKEEKENRSE